MQTRSKQQRLVSQAAAARVSAGVVPCSWQSVDEGVFGHILEQARLSRREVVRLGGVCQSWRRAVWSATTSLTVVARMDGLNLPGDESGLVPWLTSRLRAAPRLRCLRVCCGFNLVAAVMAAATAHARGLTTLELSFYVGEGVQGPLPASALLGLTKLRSLRALALGTGGDTAQPHITKLSALKQLTRLEMPYAQARAHMTHQSLATLARRLPNLTKAWLDCPGPDSWAQVGRGLSGLTDLRLDMRPDGQAVPALSAHVLGTLPTSLVSLQVTGAIFYLAQVPFDRLPHLVELGVHDRVLEESAPADVAAIAGRLTHLGDRIYLSTVGFIESSDVEDDALALDDPLDFWAWVPTLRALTAVTQLSFNSFVSDNRYTLPCLYACCLGLRGRVQHLHLYNLSREDDACDILPLVARRWGPCLRRLTLHCCEGVTPRALRALAGAAGPGMAEVHLRCCPGLSEETARAAVAAGVQEGATVPEVTHLVADWWSDD